MVKNQAIQTSLLGRKVRLGEGCHQVPQLVAHEFGEIVTIFYDNDGELKYTIHVPKTGQLFDLYPHNFLIPTIF